MNFKLFELVLTGIFATTAILVEVLRKITPPSGETPSQVNPLQTTISTYLTGPYSILEDLGFVALFGALELLPKTLNLSLAPTILLSLSGVGVLFAMLTRKVFPKLLPSLSPAITTKIHVASAAVAFSGAFLGLLGSGLTLLEKGILLGTAVVCGLLALASADALSFLPSLSKNPNFKSSSIVEKLGALGIVATLALRILN